MFGEKERREEEEEERKRKKRSSRKAKVWNTSMEWYGIYISLEHLTGMELP